MSSSPSPVRGAAATGYVLRGDDVTRIRPARMSADLTRTPFVTFGVADPRLVDPHLEAVVEQAKQEAREAGYADGHAAGFAVGRREGLELLAAEQRELLEQDALERAARKERLYELLHAVETAVAAALDYQAPRVEEMRDLIADLAIDIAETLVGHHLQIRDCAARDAVQRALAGVPRNASVIVRLHPDDIDLVNSYVDEVTDWQIARVVPDAGIPRGEAVAEAENLEVEASITDALARVRQVLHP